MTVAVTMPPALVFSTFCSLATVVPVRIGKVSRRSARGHAESDRERDPTERNARPLIHPRDPIFDRRVLNVAELVAGHPYDGTDRR
jgi:hypothetical protein